MASFKYTWVLSQWKWLVHFRVVFLKPREGEEVHPFRSVAAPPLPLGDRALVSNRYQWEYDISTKCTEMLKKKKNENCYLKRQGFQSGSVVKNPPANVGATKDLGSFLGWEDPLEKEMATHSSILAWKIAWRGAWQVTVHDLQRVRYNWAYIYTLKDILPVRFSTDPLPIF